MIAAYINKSTASPVSGKRVINKSNVSEAVMAAHYQIQVILSRAESAKVRAARTETEVLK